MYDDFSSDYDRFVGWPGRLNYEMPLIRRVIEDARISNGTSPRVLDVACGTGMHAIELARLGYSVAGADVSAGMVARARVNAIAAGVSVDFTVAGFGRLRESVVQNGAPFDVLLCLGNSLPHVSGGEELAGALRDFADCLRPGGIVLLQNRNFDAVMAAHERWMEPQSHREPGQEWLFLRFYDYRPDGRIDFNILDLHRWDDKPWQQKVLTTTLYPLVQAELSSLLRSCGFGSLIWYGSMSSDPFDPTASGNLIAVAQRI